MDQTNQGQTGAVQTGEPEISKDARTFSMLCHLLGIFTFIWGPLIVWLIKRGDDKFIDEQGKEALNWQITTVIAYVVAGLTWWLLCIGVILGILTYVCNVIFCIMGTVKANKGQHYRYPVSIRLIK